MCLAAFAAAQGAHAFHTLDIFMLRQQFTAVEMASSLLRFFVLHACINTIKEWDTSAGSTSLSQDGKVHKGIIETFCCMLKARPIKLVVEGQIGKVWRHCMQCSGIMHPTKCDHRTSHHLPHVEADCLEAGSKMADSNLVWGSLCSSNVAEAHPCAPCSSRHKVAYGRGSWRHSQPLFNGLLHAHTKQL